MVALTMARYECLNSGVIAEKPALRHQRRRGGDTPCAEAKMPKTLAAIIMSMAITAAVSAADIGEMPPGTHELKKERSIMIPMRDGTRQSANIYRLRGAGYVPVVLMRTPYSKDVQIIRRGKQLEDFA